MKHSNRKIVSVVLTTRNRKNKLIRAVKSVLSQTWQDIEIVVVDDASSDGSVEYLKEISKNEPRLRVLQNKIKKGGAVSRNLGIKNTSNEYIAFLDDDDEWISSKIENQLHILSQEPLITAVTCWFYIIFPNGKTSIKKPKTISDPQNILLQNTLGGASMCFTTKECLKNVGLFDEKMPSAQDWDLWIKLLKLGPIAVCQKPLVKYFAMQPDSITNNLTATYIGRRRIYFKYKRSMKKMVLKAHLSELLFDRKMSSPKISCSLQNLCNFIKIAGFYKTIKFFYRWVKILNYKKQPAFL